MPAQIHGKPAYNNGHAGVTAHRDQEERGVLDVPVRLAVDVEQDAEAGKADGHWDHGECEAVAQFVGACCYYHGEGPGCCPWGD